MAPVFYSQDRIPCCWGWPCWWQASPSSPWLALCCPPPSPITTTPSILPPPLAFLWTMPMVTCHIFIVQIPSLYVSRLESLKHCLAILFKTRDKKILWAHVLLSPRVSKHDCRPGSEEFSPKCLRRAATHNPGASPMGIRGMGSRIYSPWCLMPNFGEIFTKTGWRKYLGKLILTKKKPLNHIGIKN